MSYARKDFSFDYDFIRIDLSYSLILDYCPLGDKYYAIFWKVMLNPETEFKGENNS